MLYHYNPHHYLEALILQDEFIRDRIHNQHWTKTLPHRERDICGLAEICMRKIMNPMYVTTRGLTTSTMSYNDRYFQIDFDFISHLLIIETTKSFSKIIALRPCSVAEFYQEIMASLKSLNIPINIRTTPHEIPDPIPFEQDHKHTAYDSEYANRFSSILIESIKVLTRFRSNFIGKVSPVHFFWGAFDLAVTQFSGLAAPMYLGAPNLAQFVAIEAYSYEVVVISGLVVLQ